MKLRQVLFLLLLTLPSVTRGQSPVNISGNAKGFKTTPTTCTPGQAPIGIDAQGNALTCQALGGGSVPFAVVGVTAATIQLTHDALPGTGGVIFIPPGTYTSQRLIVTKDNVELWGGGDATILDISGDTSATAVIQVQANHFRAHDFLIKGNNAGVAGRSAGIILGFSSVTTDQTVQRVHMTNMGSVGVLTQNNNHVWITDNKIETDYRSCIKIGDGTHVASIGWVQRNYCKDPDLVVSSGESGIHAFGAPSTAVQDRWVISDNTIEITDGHTTVGSQLNNISNSEVAHNIVLGNRSGGEGIAITGINIDVHDNITSGSAVCGIIAFMNAAFFSNFLIHGNISFDNDSGICVVWGASTITISDVQVYGNRAYDDGAGTHPQRFGYQMYKDTGVTNNSASNVQVYGNDWSDNTVGAENVAAVVSGIVDRYSNYFFSGQGPTDSQHAFAELPAASSQNIGQRYVISDSTTVATEGQACAGGSTHKATAFSDGTTWKCF